MLLTNIFFFELHKKVLRLKVFFFENDEKKNQ